MRKKLLSIVLVGVMVLAMTSCSGELKTLGKWRIIEVTAGDITMTQQDVDDMGIDAGYIKINRSGSCEIDILGDSYDGSWVYAEDGSLDITISEDLTANAVIEDGTMTMTDSQGSVYMLQK